MSSIDEVPEGITPELMFEMLDTTTTCDIFKSNLTKLLKWEDVKYELESIKLMGDISNVQAAITFSDNETLSECYRVLKTERYRNYFKNSSG